MQKHEGCYWFGEPGRCGTYNAIEAIICFCAVLDLLVGVFQDLLLTIYGENLKRCPQPYHLGCAVGRVVPCRARI